MGGRIPHGPDGSRALRKIDRHRDALSPAAGDRLDRRVRTKDPFGIDARYIDAFADPA